MTRKQETLATLQQMLALLQGERQALAALDLERITNCTDNKLDLCARLEAVEQDSLDEECLENRANEVAHYLWQVARAAVVAELGEDSEFVPGYPPPSPSAP